MENFEVKGVRRMVVAIVAILTLGAVQVLAGVNQAAAVGIGIVTLGYFTSKFAEAASLALRAFLDRKG